MARKGRSAAILLGAICAAVLGGGVFFFRGRIVEEWYLWKLRSADSAESDRAALKLGAMGSLRAVEPLVEAFLNDDRGTSITTLIAQQNTEWLGLPPKAYALYQLGSRALPSMESWQNSEALSVVKDAIQGKFAQVNLVQMEVGWQSYPPLSSPSLTSP